MDCAGKLKKKKKVATVEQFSVALVRVVFPGSTKFVPTSSRMCVS